MRHFSNSVFNKSILHVSLRFKFRDSISALGFICLFVAESYYEHGKIENIADRKSL